MHIFAVQTQSKPGRALEGAALAKSIAELGTKETGIETLAWRAVAGLPMGTCALTGRSEDLDELNDATTKLMTIPEFAKLQKASADVLAEPAITALNQVVAAGEGYVLKKFTEVTRATIAVGQFSAAMAWSTDMLQHYQSVTGIPAMLTLSSAGAFGEVRFTFSTDTLGEIAAANEKAAEDPGYVSRLDQTGGLFNPGAETYIARRLD
ncbi:MAG: hypothetical protein OEY23_23540 [Acidimicrobiia bacterium]|nr:hypothetical protein [Acidimicrobiia bacterium]